MTIKPVDMEESCRVDADFQSPSIFQLRARLAELKSPPQGSNAPEWMRSLWIRSLEIEGGEDDFIYDMDVPVVFSTNSMGMLKWIVSTWNEEFSQIVREVAGPGRTAYLMVRPGRNASSEMAFRSPHERPLSRVTRSPRMTPVPDFTELSNGCWTKRCVNSSFLRSLDEVLLQKGNSTSVEDVLDIYDDRLDMMENILSKVPASVGRNVLRRYQREIEDLQKRRSNYPMPMWIGRQKVIDILSRDPEIGDYIRTGKLQSRPSGTVPGASSVLSIVSEWCCVTPEDIRGTSRVRHVARARSIAALILRKMNNLTLIRIGDYMSGRDHSSILSLINTIEMEISRDAGYRDMVANIMESCEREGVRLYCENTLRGRLIAKASTSSLKRKSLTA